MSSRLPRVSGKRVVRAFLRAGYTRSHQRGSHHYLRGPGGLVCVPVHGDRVLPVGTLRAIQRQVGLSREEFIRLLEGG